MALEFLLMSLRFNSFLCSGMSKAISVCVCGGGGGLVVIKCIYLPPTYLHFIQDIEDRYLLLMSSTSLIDLPFQEHRIIKNIIWTKIHAYLQYVQNKA
jgi:hypothetical protein